MTSKKEKEIPLIEKTLRVKPEFVFGKKNYTIMIIAMAIIVIGFVLMVGRTDIYDFRKTTLAPFVVLLGFGVGVFAIMKKAK